MVLKPGAHSGRVLPSVQTLLQFCLIRSLGLELLKVSQVKALLLLPDVCTLRKEDRPVSFHSFLFVLLFLHAVTS